MRFQLKDGSTKVNLFQIDLDSIEDDLEREATVGIIHNCRPISFGPAMHLSSIPFL